MSIQLLALDLDGTIVADLHTIPARTQAAIKAAMSRGVQVTLATGREYEITKKFVDILGLTTPIICCQGALIYNAQTGKVVGSEGFPTLVTHELIDLARTHRLALHLCLNNQVYAEYLTPKSREIFAAVGATVIEVRDLKQQLTTSPIKGLIIHAAVETGAVMAELQAALGNSLNIFQSLDTMIELISLNVSKGSALATLANYYGIPQSEVMAIGDQDNDIEMIAWAGLGIAMGNASEGAKAVADYIAPPLSDEGAAWAIEHFILEQG